MKEMFVEKVSNFDRLGQWEVKGGICHLKAHIWQGHTWEHEIKIYRPLVESISDACYVEITGDNAGLADDTYGQALADALRMPVATVFQVPNQPLWDMREDDLIAHTFEKFVETGDGEWPLLVPMVRSAICALDTLDAWFEGNFKKYIVGGASKRGWTSWLLAQAGDDRVAGIVPVVFDNLGISVQMQHQQELWAEQSPMLDDYTRRKLHEISDTDRGRELVEMVDPWTGLADQKIPALVITGSNDPYWTVDATRHYYSSLPKGSGLLVVPNMGHSTGEWDFRFSTVAAFCAACLGKGKFPEVHFDIVEGERGVEFSCNSEVDPNAIRIWGATSENYWFADSEFFVDILPETNVRIRKQREQNQALFLEVEFAGSHGPVRLTSPCAIIPKIA